MGNPNDNKVSFEEAYQKLHGAYIKRLENSIEAIENILTQKQLGPLKKEALQRAVFLVHGLAGSATTFGFPEISAGAKKCDVFLEKVIASMATDQAMTETDFESFEKMMLALQESCKTALKNKDAKKPIQGPDNAPTNSELSETHQFFVLVVDDDEHLSALLAEKLKQKNIRVIVAGNGQSALNVLTREVPDLIILDIKMPGISGHEVLQRLKQDPQFLRIPIIMLTGQTEQKDVVSALHAGAIDYIVKPVDLDHLIARAEKVLDASRYEIVVADNDALLLQLIGNWYREKGFRVKLLEDGKKAWDYIISNVPDLVILDRMMPGLEGLSVLKNMREEDSTRHIPVMILSARKQERDVAEAMKRGAQDYLAKPFVPDDLIDRSLKLLKKKEKK
jgi:two-component system, cell cycle response regulator